MNNSYYLLYDLLQGDNSVVNRNDFKDLNFSEIKDTLQIIKNNPNLSDIKITNLLNNLWRINYIEKTPSIEEFLTIDWIGPTALDLYSHVKNTIIDFFDPQKEYKNLYLAACIGFGKTTSVAVIILFIIVHTYLLRNYKKYYTIAESSYITAVLGSFTLTKVKQLLVKPFLNILQSSPKFRRVKQEERLYLTLEEEKKGNKRIPWTTASSMDSAVQFAKDLHIMIVSDPASILGLNILTGALTELSFWIDKGISSEEIMRMVNDLKGRIFSRFGNAYFARTIIDSSPNTWDSPVDKYVFSGEAEQDKKNLIIKAKHWELQDFKFKYEKWNQTKEVFYVFRGSAGNPTKEILESEIKNYHPEEVLKIPIDLYDMYNKDPEKIIKDYGGYPSSGIDKLISNYKDIDKIFINNLRNIEYGIKAPANKNPQDLIWDQIKDIFFININNQYRFYRNSKEKRYIHIDQSYVTDMTSIVCGHPELSVSGEKMVILDFTIAIIPDKNKINLDSIADFIIALKVKGKLNLDLVTYDGFESAGVIQRLNRYNINTKRFSVDINIGAYYLLVSLVKNHMLKCGKNIILKNNLKSIQEVYTEKGKKKIDHVKGKLVTEYNNDWNNSTCGINAKDVGDGAAGVTHHCLNEFEGTPRYIYHPVIQESNKNSFFDFIKNEYKLIPKNI